LREKRKGEEGNREEGGKRGKERKGIGKREMGEVRGK